MCKIKAIITIAAFLLSRAFESFFPSMIFTRFKILEIENGNRLNLTLLSGRFEALHSGVVKNDGEPAASPSQTLLSKTNESLVSWRKANICYRLLQNRLASITVICYCKT